MRQGSGVATEASWRHSRNAGITGAAELSIAIFARSRMTEKRRAPRHKSLLRGFVYFGNNPSAVDCLVRDMSDTGARLKFAGQPHATDTLSLNIPARGQTFHAKVTWQHADEIGIAFINVAAVGATPANEAELFIRVNKLETEITALKQLIRRLQRNTGDKTEVA